MNKGINELFKLIENETSRDKRRKQKLDGSHSVRSRMPNEQFTFQPKINKKSHQISAKDGQESSQRILKGNQEFSVR